MVDPNSRTLVVVVVVVVVVVAFGSLDKEGSGEHMPRH